MLHCLTINQTLIATTRSYRKLLSSYDKDSSLLLKFPTPLLSSSFTFDNVRHEFIIFDDIRTSLSFDPKP